VKTDPPFTPERPLPDSVRLRLILSATAVIGGFYLFSFAALLAMGLILAAEIALLLGMARFGAAGLIGRALGPQLRLGSLLLTSLNLKPGVEYNVEIRRDEAPRLFALLEDVARRVGVSPPDSVRLEMTCGAWVRLRGYRQGRGRTVLGIGYELLAVLSEAEFRAVMAHEMAHARLVQRGYRGWMMNGVSRIQNFARSADALRPASEPGKKPRRFQTAALLARIADGFARTGTRAAALYSRQDEFAADRRAAEVCGAAVCREALVRSSFAGERSHGISWRDYLVRTQRRESLGDWLRARLLPADAAGLREWEAKALAETHRSEYDTHPLFSDRIAALPPGG
jgi:Zn-dependent protease with chaperone function